MQLPDKRHRFGYQLLQASSLAVSPTHCFIGLPFPASKGTPFPAEIN